MQITQKQIRRSMNWSIAAGALSMFWFITATPQQILSVFIQNYLGADSFQLGLIISGMNLAAVMNLLSIVIFSRLEGRKAIWIGTTLAQRLLSLGLAGAAFAASLGMNRQGALILVGISSVLSALFGNISGSGWWAWMSDLVPEHIRGRFFGRRSAVSQVVNVAVFMAITFALDYWVDYAFTLFTLIYLAAALFGALDVLFHLPMPDIKKGLQVLTLKRFFEPMRDRRFRRFCFSVGAFLLSINIGAPFLAPFTIDSAGGGAPVAWLGYTFLISQAVWVLVVPFWGVIMDRMGKKSVVTIGGLFVLSWIGYLFMNPTNYWILLPVISVAGGFLAPAFWEGISQLMLTLSPPGKQDTYAAWYWTFFGVMASIGPVIGGAVGSFVSETPLFVGSREIPAISAVILLSILGVLFSLSHVIRLEMKSDKSLTLVLSTVFNPGIFRAVSNIGLLSRPAPAKKVEAALRRVEGQIGSLSFDEIRIRLDDPDLEVREEAALAMARLGTPEAGDVLLQNLKDENSLTRSMCARGLGQMGRQDAVEPLFDILKQLENEEMDRALALEAIHALGRLGAGVAGDCLIRIMKNYKNKQIQLAAAEALSTMKCDHALEHVYYWFDWAPEWRERRQLTLDLGRMIGDNDDIYLLVTGNRDENEKMIIANCQRLNKRIKNPSLKRVGDFVMERQNREAFELLYGILKQQTLTPVLERMRQLLEGSLESEHKVTLHHVILALYVLKRSQI